MLLLQQSPHAKQTRLADAITLDDFVAVVHVSINATTKAWGVCALGNSGDTTRLIVTSAGLSLQWDSERKNVGHVAGFGNGVQLFRIERLNSEFTLTTLEGSFPMQSIGDGTDGPISFDLIGGLADSLGCRVLGVAILPGHPTAEDVARVEVGLAGYQLS